MEILKNTRFNSRLKNENDLSTVGERNEKTMFHNADYRDVAN